MADGSHWYVDAEADHVAAVLAGDEQPNFGHKGSVK